MNIQLKSCQDTVVNLFWVLDIAGQEGLTLTLAELPNGQARFGALHGDVSQAGDSRGRLSLGFFQQHLSPT